MNNWISTKKEMPPDGMEVLVYVPQGPWSTYWMEVAEWDGCNWGGISGECLHRSPTYWIELPPVPKAENVRTHS